MQNVLAKADVSVHSNSVQEVQEKDHNTEKLPPDNEQNVKLATDDLGDLPAATTTDKTDSQPMPAREKSGNMDGDKDR